MRILVCTNALSMMDGTIYHRIYAPFKYLHEVGLNIDFCADFLSQQFSELLKYDAIVISRTITYNPLFHDHALAMWNQMPNSTRLIVDLDDYWILPDGHPNRHWWSKHNTGQCIIDTLRIASEVWTTNNRLKKKIGRIADRVTVIPNGIRFKSISKTNSSTIRIGIIVNPTHEMNLELVKNGLKTLDIDKYEIRLIGSDASRRSNIDSVLDIRETGLRYRHIGWKKPIGYESIYQDVDVLLCPLAANNFNKYRSRLKLEEASAFKFKVVASDYGPYSNQKQDGVIVTNNFNKLDQHLLELESQSFPETVDSWSDVQQLRIDRLNKLVYDN